MSELIASSGDWLGSGGGDRKVNVSGRERTVADILSDPALGGGTREALGRHGGACGSTQMCRRDHTVTESDLDVEQLGETFTRPKAGVLIVNEHRDTRHRLASQNEYAPPFPAIPGRRGTVHEL